MMMMMTMSYLLIENVTNTADKRSSCKLCDHTWQRAVLSIFVGII